LTRRRWLGSERPLALSSTWKAGGERHDRSPDKLLRYAGVDAKDNDIEEIFSGIERVIAWDLKKLRTGNIELRRQEKAHLKESLEQPGAMEKLLANMKLEGDQNIEDVESLKKLVAEVFAGQVPLVQDNKAWNAKVMLGGDRVYHV
jgi:hypothetical protein